MIFEYFNCDFVSFVSGFCPDFRHILNGEVVHVSPSIGKAAVRFRCNKEFRLIGTPRLECINGKWNGMLPFCESKFGTTRASHLS